MDYDVVQWFSWGRVSVGWLGDDVIWVLVVVEGCEIRPVFGSLRNPSWYPFSPLVRVLEVGFWCSESWRERWRCRFPAVLGRILCPPWDPPLISGVEFCLPGLRGEIGFSGRSASFDGFRCWLRRNA